MERFDGFWRDMELCDWYQLGDDNKVLAPLIESLSQRDDDEIFTFHDRMAELLYKLDTKKLAKQHERSFGYFSDDVFLYSRCCGLTNGPEYYQQALAGRKREMWTMEFESLLYVPGEAWALKHGRDYVDYPHLPPFNIESGSNAEGWK